ncbi:MAG: diaminopimelate decarboxylase [Gaiellaceae bacterium]|nr:diaminopimelate decarboxylase [Gaiellaceae bacterium]
MGTPASLTVDGTEQIRTALCRMRGGFVATRPEGRLHGVLDLFPDTASIDAGGELVLGGVGATDLAREFGTPLVVLDESTLRARARAYRQAAPDALIVYGTKAFPNVAVLEVLAEEGLGADVSTLGELEFAVAAQVPAERLVVHGNNKSDAELARAAEVGAGLVVLDATEELDRAAAARIERVLLRVTPGIDADTHASIRTGHAGSKFGFTPEAAVEAVTRARELGLGPVGLHVHLGSQLVDARAGWASISWLAGFASTCARATGWSPELVDLGGGLAVRHVPDEPNPSIDHFVSELVQRVERGFAAHALPTPRLVLEPGRSVVGPAGVTLYRIGVVKEAADATRWVAVDGGMSDNPRPQLYDARYTALIADRAGEGPTATYSVGGKHCESGDVLIRRVALANPRRGDVLAVPVTGAYTLAMASNYNGVPRPAAVLVADGQARLIRRRETVDDLLGLEAPASGSRHESGTDTTHDPR